MKSAQRPKTHAESKLLSSASEHADVLATASPAAADIEASPRQLAQRQLIQRVAGTPGPDVVQMERRATVVGGLDINLDTVSDEHLLDYYKHYFMPNRHSDNYAAFGVAVREELTRRNIAIPTLNDVTEWVGTRKDPHKFGILLGCFYRPVSPHTEAGNSHYLSDQPAIENSRSAHTKMTEDGVRLMFHALDVIHQARAIYLHTDESFTNVHVKVNGVKWGLHLGDGRQIFPISGQNLPQYFDK